MALTPFPVQSRLPVQGSFAVWTSVLANWFLRAWELLRFVENCSTITAVATGANRDVLASESGITFTNEGATARQDFTLPLAFEGLQYTFTILDTDGIRVIPNTGDTIRIGASESGVGALGRIDCTGIGGTVTLKALNATQWVATSQITSWTVT